MTKVEIDEGSGFCFGVVNAIKKAEEELSHGKTLYCLGDIVHNGREVKRLETRGLVTIDREEFKKLHDVKVLLRAHGEPPETYEIARKNNIEIIDATCPVVLRLQKRIKQEYIEDDTSKIDTDDKQIVIYGKNGHAEVLGLVGQTAGKAIVIEHFEETEKLDFSKDIRLYSQTTKSLDGFKKIVEYIEEHISPEATFEYYDTICRQVANRMPNIRNFSASHDLIFLVSGEKSSNGKVLFNECKKVNPNSYLIESLEGIDLSLCKNAKSIGICGATSTPKWLMEEICIYIKSQIKAPEINVIY
ncbi:MAG: 4-hydroxy-3-methylbut-2-enyl diphosphate reductase [Bacteroidetes bacterium]|jgi:4-hydroxy-3-methylbut-2-en-1-yl diphosphate reductase|nr:4-hydroxy-3-methylbut-2-enyl diphosphate reductase [Bacteroidota bacterium]